MSFIQQLIAKDSSVPGAVPARVLEVDQTDSPCLMLLTHLVCCAENFWAVEINMVCFSGLFYALLYFYYKNVLFLFSGKKMLKNLPAQYKK